MKTLVRMIVVGIGVIFLASSMGYAACGTGGLTVNVTPDKLVLANEGFLNSPPVVMAHIKAGASTIQNPDALKITCINGVSVDIPAVPGMVNKTGNDGLVVAFYRGKLVEAIKSMSVTGDVSITVGVSGGAVSIPILTVASGVDTPIFTGDLTAFTNLNLGTPSGEVIVYLTIVSGGTLVGGCQLGDSYTSGNPLSISLDTSGCPVDLTNATLTVTVYGDASEITFTGVSLTGPGGAGVSGTDTIRVQ